MIIQRLNNVAQKAVARFKFVIIYFISEPSQTDRCRGSNSFRSVPFHSPTQLQMPMSTCSSKQSENTRRNRFRTYQMRIGGWRMRVTAQSLGPRTRTHLPSHLFFVANKGMLMEIITKCCVVASGCGIRGRLTDCQQTDGPSARHRINRISRSEKELSRRTASGGRG